jgi:hypothetical protein
LLAEKFLNLFRPAGAPALNGSGLAGPRLPQRAVTSRSPQLAALDRTSNGLRQFFENLRSEERLRILDLGGASQANVNFIAVRGHKLYTEDLLTTIHRMDAAARQAPAGDGLVARFLEENLNFGAEHFDGVLVWDTLEFLDDELLAAALGRLQATLKPGGTLLTFFHTSGKGEPVPVYRYEIRDPQTLHLEPRFWRPLPRAFNNRHLERLFGSFNSVKFFLAKDGLREVIVTR